MKTITISCILVAVFLIHGCRCSGDSDANNDMKPTKNAFNSPGEALQQTKEHLHLILNENQRKAFGLASDEEIMRLETRVTLPITYVSMDQIDTTTSVDTAHGYWYGLGGGNASKIGVSVEQVDDVWVQHTIGMMKFVTATNRHGNTSRLIEIPGLEMSFLELTDEQRKAYTPIADYREAKLVADSLYSWDELRRLVGTYRIRLEREFGKDFINGSLDR